jgi:hypothetical protein
MKLIPRTSLRQTLLGDCRAPDPPSHGPSAIAPLLELKTHSLDPNVAPGEVITMREQLDRGDGAAANRRDDPRRLRHSAGR